MTFFRSSKHQRLLWSLLLLSVGAAAGFGLGIFCGAEPPVGCRESDLTPVPDESFVSPASASSVETSPEPEPMPEKWVCLTFDDGPQQDDAGRSVRAEPCRSKGDLLCSRHRQQRQISFPHL